MLEIAMLIWGLVVLISGKTKRKGRELVGPKARISGLILMAPIPIALAVFFGLAAATGEAIDRCAATAIEVGIVIACLVVANSYVTNALGPPELDLEVFNDSNSATGAAWRSDPTARHQYRYWDGASWTSYVSDNGQQSVDAFDEGPQTTKEALPGATASQSQAADWPKPKFPRSVVEAYDTWCASGSGDDRGAFLVALAAAKPMLSQGIGSRDVGQVLRDRFPRAAGAPAFEEIVGAVSSAGSGERESDESADDPWASATCPHCGAVNEPGGFTCEACGQPILV